MLRFSSLLLFSLSSIILLESGARAADGDMTLAAISKRLEPVGKLAIEDQLEQNEAVTVSKANEQTVKQALRSGKEIYGTVCMRCHAKGAARAPRFGHSTEWAERIDKGEDILVSHALTGFHYMPPKGYCNNCTPEEIKAAVHYMVQNSR